MKSWWGDTATAENNLGFDYLPKLDKLYDMLQVFELMSQGKMNGYICQGFNPLAAAPNKAKIGAGLSKLKFLVIMDPLATETSEFWKNFGEYNDVDPSKIQTEVFRLPTTCFAEEDGSLVNSGRWLQWHWKGAEPPGEARSDLEIMSGLFLRIRGCIKDKGGTYPDPILKLTWPYRIPESPTPEELAMEFNGKALADVTDPTDTTKVLAKTGEQLAGFAQLRDDGTHGERLLDLLRRVDAGRQPDGAARQLRSDRHRPDARTGRGRGRRTGAFSTTAPRATSSGKPFDPTRKLIAWNGKAWSGADVPDFKADEPPENGMNPFIMNRRRRGALLRARRHGRRSVPRALRAVRDAARLQPAASEQPRRSSAIRRRACSRTIAPRSARPKDFPHTATTYRLTEHFHYWTKHARLNAIMQPQQFVEIGEELAKEMGMVAGDRVKVSSNRGHIIAVAVVTKRIKPLMIEGKKVHTVGIPIHWGFKGLTKPGYLVNTLTPFVGDGNTQTPEFKSFLVKVEKA